MKTISQRFPQALTLLAVVEAGGFTRAAERLGLSKAQVSKQVSALEASLGVKLLHRTTRRVALTDAGQLYLDYARQARNALDDGDRAVSAVRTEVDGLLRLTAPTSFGDGFLADLLADFRTLHSAIRLDVDLSIGTRDLIGESYDFAIRMARTLDAALVARPLGVMREIVVASPDYVARQCPQGITEPGQLATLEALRNNHFHDEGRWILQRGEASVSVPVQGTLAINHFVGIRRAVLRSQGIARLPRYLVSEEIARGGLVQLLPEWQLPPTPVALVYPSRKHLPHRSQVFRDFVVDWIAKAGVLD
jgi:DNA-binding transcriptional LysR family regulator